MSFINGKSIKTKIKNLEDVYYASHNLNIDGALEIVFYIAKLSEMIEDDADFVIWRGITVNNILNNVIDNLESDRPVQNSSKLIRKCEEIKRISAYFADTLNDSQSWESVGKLIDIIIPLLKKKKFS